MTRVTRHLLALALLTAAATGSASSESAAEIRTLLAAGEMAEAEAAARAAVERLEGTTDPALADALDLLVEILLASDRADDGEIVPLAERAVGLRRTAGGNPPELASSLARLGEALTARGELERAAAVLAEAEATVPADDAVGHARVLNRLAAVRIAEGDLPEATRLHAAALASLELGSAPGEPELDRALVCLGDVSYKRRDMSAALHAYQRLLEARSLTRGEGDAKVGEALHLLASATAGSGDLAAAEGLYRRAIQTLESALGPDHPNVGSAVNNLALVTKKRGDYLETSRLLERALAIYERHLGPAHPHVAGTLNNLGSVRLNLGDLPAAREAYERGLAIREQRFGPDSPEVAQSLNNLGSVALKEYQAARAVALYDRALAIREKTLGGDDPAVGLILANLGEALQQAGQLEPARASLERAARILERSRESSWVLANTLNNLGLVLLRLERLPEAAVALERARGIVEGTRGHAHPVTATIMHNQAKPVAFVGRVAAALGLTLESARIRRDHLGLTSAGLSEREALAFAAQHQGALDLALSLTTEPDLDDPTMVAATWHAVIRSRALVLDEMASRRRGLSTPDNAELTEALRGAASRLSRLLVEGSGSGSANEVEGARRDLERAERALAGMSPPFARELFRARLGLEEVVSSLPEGVALVAYARYHRRFTQDPARRHEIQATWYLAFLRTPVGTVQVVPLAEAAIVERLAREWRAAAGRPTGGERAALEAGERLRELIWDPVADKVGDAEQVFVVPDGELGLLNFAALPTGPGSFLVEHRPLIAMLGQERDLVPDPLETQARSCLLALGAPDFDAAPVGVTGPGNPPAVGFTAASRSAAVDLAGTRFAPLPGTAEETGAVTDLWQRADPRAVALRLTGGEASEAAFKTLAPGFRVLHLATHGFFLDGASTPPTEAGRGVGGLVPADTAPALPAASDPLRLSGLALAGANRRDLAAAEDGILTAEEISVLDLSGVEWAVLSACESGVGEASTSEGVFGLRRAFRIAGARTVIMSLWPVDDQVAREWMTALYNARLRDGLSTAEAVRRASLEVLAARRARGESTHPASWAAFVASGDWR